MLVDLARNDLGRIARIGTVRVTDLMAVHRYSHVMHLVSVVAAELRDDVSPVDVIRATFPAGTLAGAPKVRAMQLIDDLEPTRRGPYGGGIGYVDLAGDVDLCIAIRTILFAGGARVRAGRRRHRGGLRAPPGAGGVGQQGHGTARGGACGRAPGGAHVSAGRDRALAGLGAVLGGLLVGAGGAGGWRTLERARQVGTVAVTDVRTVPGGEVAPTVVAWGIALVVVGLVLLALRGRMILVGSGVVVALAVAAGVAAGLGLVRAAGEPGTLAAGGPMAAGGAVVALAGGVAGLRAGRGGRGGRARALPARYDLEADPGDEAAAAWDEVSVEDPGAGRST